MQNFSNIMKGCVYYKDYVKAKDLDDVAEQIKGRIMFEMRKQALNDISEQINERIMKQAETKEQASSQIVEQIKDKIEDLKVQPSNEEEIDEFNWFRELIDKVIKIDVVSGSNKFSDLFSTTSENLFDKMLYKLTILTIQKTNDELGL